MRISRLLLLCSAWTVFFSCSPEKGPEEIPEGIIVPDSMVQLLADIHLAESRILINGTGPGTVLPKKAYILEILKNRNIDTASFSKSFTFYASHPAVFEVVYEGVMEEIGKRQAMRRVEK